MRHDHCAMEEGIDCLTSPVAAHSTPRVKVTRKPSVLACLGPWPIIVAKTRQILRIAV